MKMNKRKKFIRNRSEDRDMERGFGGGKGKGRGRGRGRGGHGRGPRRGRGGPEGRSGRILRKGELKWLLLSLIAETPRHGYDLMVAIEDKTEGLYKPSPGVTYPALEVLRDQGWVSVDESSGKKIFSATPEGQAALNEEAATIAEILKRLETAKETGEAAGDHPVRREVRQLVHTVKKTARSDGKNRDAVIAILQEAREKIEALT